jgi:ribosomal protein S18 acetylase RimI-like enzyme
MELLLERWRSLGADAASLSVVEGNPAAVAFYESLGFRLTGEREEGELVMRLTFEPSE